MKITLATRGSKLALWQAEEASRLLAIAHPEALVEIHTVRSGGDADTRTDLARFGRTGIFTAEVDAAVLSGAADAGVHSLKDMTTSLPEGLALAGALARGPVEDVLISRGGARLADLPSGSRVATGSARRIAMIRSARPDLEVVGIRGNVETRVLRLQAGHADALVLARAGLVRLRLERYATEILDLERFLPAVGQGIVGLVCRADDERAARALQAISDREAWAEALAERALLRELHGGCNAPIGALARAKEGAIAIRACVLSADGSERLEDALSGRIDEAEALGRALAGRLAARGALRLVESARPR